MLHKPMTDAERRELADWMLKCFELIITRIRADERQRCIDAIRREAVKRDMMEAEVLEQAADLIDELEDL